MAYDPRDFGATAIRKQENHKGSGYTHHTAHTDKSGDSRFSWDEVEYKDSQGNQCREVVNVHDSRQ